MHFYRSKKGSNQPEPSTELTSGAAPTSKTVKAKAKTKTKRKNIAKDIAIKPLILIALRWAQEAKYVILLALQWAQVKGGSVCDFHVPAMTLLIWTWCMRRTSALWNWCVKMMYVSNTMLNYVLCAPFKFLGWWTCLNCVLWSSWHDLVYFDGDPILMWCIYSSKYRHSDYFRAQHLLQ